MQQETWADIYSTEGRDKDFKLNTDQYGPQRDRRKLTKSEITLSGERSSGGREENKKKI